MAPRDRDEKQLDTLMRMTAENKFFTNMRLQYGEYTYNQMIRYCYLE